MTSLGIFANRVFSESILHATNVESKSGLDFIAVGDFGNVADMSLAKKVFSKVESISPKDFLLTTGDNVYPVHPDDPEDWEIETVLDLF